MNPREYFRQHAPAGSVLQLAPAGGPRPGILVDGSFLAAPRRPSVQELRVGMDTRTLTGRKPTKYTYIFADRRRDMPPLFWRVVSQLEGNALFYPTERIPVFLRLCDLGLAEARAMQEVDRLGYRQLRKVLYDRTWLHPETPIFWQSKTRWRDDAGFSFELGGPPCQ